MFPQIQKRCLSDFQRLCCKSRLVNGLYIPESAPKSRSVRGNGSSNPILEVTYTGGWGADRRFWLHVSQQNYIYNNKYISLNTNYLLRFDIQQVIYQHLDTIACRLGRCIIPHRSGHINVCPFSLFHELFQEQCGSDTTTSTSTNIL